jgi:cytochrome b subunit of formate dehydrogenase
MRQVAIIFATTVLSGLVLIALFLLIAPPVLGPVLVAIGRLPSPFGGIAWVAVLFPIGVIGPPILWFGIYRIVSRVCGHL